VKKSVEIARMIREENERLAADRAARGEPTPVEDATDDAEDEGGEAPDAPDHADQPGPAEGSADRPD
jgi:ribosome-binding factor A